VRAWLASRASPLVYNMIIFVWLELLACHMKWKCERNAGHSTSTQGRLANTRDVTCDLYCILNVSLTTSVTFQKFCFLSCSQATGNNFTISGSPRQEKPLKCGMLQSVCQFFLCLNLSWYPLYIFIAHQLIHILKLSICHFLLLAMYNVSSKIIEQKDCFKWDPNPHFQCAHLLCYHLH